MEIRDLCLPLWETGVIVSESESESEKMFIVEHR
jgi:hypothetical protein